MYNLKTQFMGLTLALCLAATSALAGVPQLVDYQGHLTDETDQPVPDGTYDIKFAIYGTETGQDTMWSSGFGPVDVKDGLFSHQLGSVVPFPEYLFDYDTLHHLGITVSGNAEISPRTRLTSSPFALHADNTTHFGSRTPDEYLPQLSQRAFHFIVHKPGVDSPVAYGTISAEGTTLGGTGNFSCFWNEALSRYEITIFSEPYTSSSYATSVTAISEDVPCYATTAGEFGILYVYMWEPWMLPNLVIP
jgi:hypothetical protein